MKIYGLKIIRVAAGICGLLLSAEVLHAQQPPLRVEIPADEDLTYPAGWIYPGMERQEIAVPLSVSAEQIRAMPDFYREPLAKPLSEEFKNFLKTELLAKESIYFTPGIGIDAKTGMPYDHIRVRLIDNYLGETGNYTAASKLSLLIPYLVRVIQGDSRFVKSHLPREDAEKMLRNILKTLQKYNKEYPEHKGFLPWVDIRPNGTIAPAGAKMPSLDNGQMTWALASVSAAFKNSRAKKLKELTVMADKLLAFQDYRLFYDDRAGLLHGTIQYDEEKEVWHGDKTYYLNDMFEGTMAVLWAVLHKQIPEEAWHHLEIPVTDYTTSKEERVTTLRGFRASFHEHWALAFLPFMESSLAPLYLNYLYVQMDHARINGLPGFSSTAYDPKGIYRQMGVAGIAEKPVDRQDVAVFFATAMGMLIHPEATMPWLEKFYRIENFVTKNYGAVESYGSDGLSDILTADAKGMTLLASSGGVTDLVTEYLKTHAVPGTGISMYDKFLALLDAKYEQMIRDREGERIYYPSSAFSLPPEKIVESNFTIPLSPEREFNVTEHLQSGHLHGRGVTSLNSPTLEMDVAPGAPFAFEFNIPAYLPYFEQWAFRGTYIDEAIRIDEMRYLSITVPNKMRPTIFEVELKSDDITLAAAVVDTGKPGVYSRDGKWKTLVFEIKPIPEAGYKPFNYFSVSLHDPRYMMGIYKSSNRKGTVYLENIQLFKEHPYRTAGKELIEAKAHTFEDLELVRYWRLSHGDLPFRDMSFKGVYRISGGAGWRGGYIPYTNLERYKYLYLRVTDRSGGCNCFHLEIKHEGEQVVGYKVPILIPEENPTMIYEIRIPDDIKTTMNYLAFSDPYGAFDVESVVMTQTPILDENIVRLDPASEVRQLKCSNLMNR